MLGAESTGMGNRVVDPIRLDDYEGIWLDNIS